MLDSTYYVLLTLSPMGFTRHQLPNCWLFWLIKVSVISLAKWFQGAQWSKSVVYNVWSFAWVQKNYNAKVISIYINTKVARKGWEGLKILCSPSWVSQWGQSNDCPHVTLIDPHSPIQSGLTTAEKNPWTSSAVWFSLGWRWLEALHTMGWTTMTTNQGWKENSTLNSALFQYACWNNALRQ